MKCVKKYVPLVTHSLLMMFALTGCKYKPEAVGKAREIVVFSQYKDIIENDLMFCLGQEIFTPQAAPEFLVRYENFSQFSLYKERHSLFFAGLESDSLIVFLRKFDPELSANDSFALFRVEDLWAKNQTVVVYVAADTQNLTDGLAVIGAKLRAEFKNSLLSRMERMTYTSGENKKLSKESREYGFELRIPQYWSMEEEYADSRFIWVHTHEPDRAVFIYWEPAERKDISAETMIELRDSLCARFYDGDYLHRPLTTAGPFFYRSNQAIRIQGVWQNDSLHIGGPMVSFSFNEDGKFYMIDAMLFYPETPRKKIFWLNQLEVILATFKPL